MLPVLYCYPSPWTFIRVNDGSRLIHQGSESRLVKTDYLDPNYWTSCTRNPFQGKVQGSLSRYSVCIFIWLPPKHTQTHEHTHIHTHILQPIVGFTFFLIISPCPCWRFGNTLSWDQEGHLFPQHQKNASIGGLEYSTWIQVCQNPKPRCFKCISLCLSSLDDCVHVQPRKNYCNYAYIKW